MNQRGGITNIIVAIIIVVFVLLALMTPINFLVEQADLQLSNLNGTTRYARDPITNETITMNDGGASLGALTMTFLTGLGFIFLLGLVVYIILFGPNTQRPQDPLTGGF
jgi:hypothetical protein